MIKSAASKVMWVGRATVFLVGLAVILTLVFGVASTAMGADGGNFILGKKNMASAISTLAKQGPGPALSLVVKSGQPPLKVNSTGKVPRLNADMVDGKHAGAFLPKGGKAADSDKLDGISSNELARSGKGFSKTLVSLLTFTSRTSATVNAPADGFVIVNGTVVLDTFSSTCNPCYAHAHIFNTTNGEKSLDQVASLGNGTSSTHRDVMPMTWVFPVNAGDNTFELRTSVYPSGAPLGFYNPTLTALYVPYGANGTTALASNSKLAPPMGEEWEESSGGIMRKK